ncbi:hypothetical protein FJTKL_11747 [Diaporthe vaccinii]|uniref:HotDog ACOT-type domain-containing protein n=1 Tax=Diaporthe vaccinii TaxID=105482 RepID=A0ABR4EG07_9PEZI
MAGRPKPWAACRSADLVASSCRARWCASSGLCSMLTAHQTRRLATTAPRATDGVFRGLTDGRLPTPWIEAFRKQQADKTTTAREARPQERDLSPRKMSDSYHRVVLPLGQDPWLSDTYINSSGHIRLGTIFMDLDALSGVIVYKHTGPGVTTVTAALDRITIAHPLTEICDLEYSGQVTYASGRSSVEITCRVARARLEGEPARPEDELLTCTFTMVALDTETKKPVNVPALVCETPEEEAIFKAGEAKSLAKKKMSKTSLLATEPNDPESALIHNIWLRQLRYHDPNDSLRQPANVVPMSTTQLSTAAIMQPQYRNRHQTMIFGGFHLKQTFELAFCCAASFAHARPVCLLSAPRRCPSLLRSLTPPPPKKKRKEKKTRLILGPRPLLLTHRRHSSVPILVPSETPFPWAASCIFAQPLLIPTHHW